MPQYGQNGFNLNFDDTSAATAAALGKDSGPNSQNWTPVSFALSRTTGKLIEATGALPILLTNKNGDQVSTDGVASDALAANLVLAITAAGANNSTALTDESAKIRNSGSAKTITVNGAAAISTAKSRFYGSSLNMTSSGSYLSLGSSSDFAFGTGDFTVEFWCFLNATAGGSRFTAFATSGTGNTLALSHGPHYGSIRFYTNGSEAFTGTPDYFPVQKWMHIAVTRASGVVRLFMDGVQRASGTVTTDFTGDTAWVGYDPVSRSGTNVAYNGNIQDFRVYKGVAKYTANFIVPGTMSSYNNEASFDSPSRSFEDNRKAEIEYIVVGGGGGGAGEATGGGGVGGGGAGGYRSSINGENSGGGSSAESTFLITTSVPYLVTVGNGGAAGVGRTTAPGNGVASVFARITSIGGGAGGNGNAGFLPGSGGSGGGAGYALTNQGVGVSAQGYAGGAGGPASDSYTGGGGGGSASAGSAGAAVQAGAGGAGLISSVTGTGLYRAGGGGGGAWVGGVGGPGGIGGGGAGGVTSDGTSGTTNTGGGGGAGGANKGSTSTGGNGGSGVIILRYSADLDIVVTPGVVYETILVKNKKVTTITAAGATDSIQFVPVEKKTYCTWNPQQSIASSLSRSNRYLQLRDYYKAVSCGTVGVTSGKWYWEVVPNGSSRGITDYNDPYTTQYNLYMVGIADLNASITTRSYVDANGWYYYGYDGTKYNTNTSASYGTGYGTNDVIGVALDMDAGTVTFYKNGVSQGVAYTGLTGKKIAPAVSAVSSSTAYFAYVQNSRSFFGNFNPQDFMFTPPAGFKPLSVEDASGVSVSKSLLSSFDDLFKIQYLVIGGGGSGGSHYAGAGGGAGGYRSSIYNEMSGGGYPAESPITITAGTAYTVTVGSGGTYPRATDVNGKSGGNGSNSVFSTVTSLGGGGGGRYAEPWRTDNRDGLSGGSGGGGGTSHENGTPGIGGVGKLGQGFAGGNSYFGTAVTNAGGGGGGAGSPGEDSELANTGGAGGKGVPSYVTGTKVYRAGGGGGATSQGLANGGIGGGGNGTWNPAAGAGTANTGSGGGGSYAEAAPGAGGSGVVILKYSSLLTLTPSAGITSTTTTLDDGFKVTVITAAGPTDTVTFTYASLETNGVLVKTSIASELESVSQPTESDLVLPIDTPISLFIESDESKINQAQFPATSLKRMQKPSKLKVNRGVDISLEEDSNIIFENEITFKIPLYCTAEFSSGVFGETSVDGEYRVYRIVKTSSAQETVTFRYNKNSFAPVKNVVPVEYLVLGGGGGTQGSYFFSTGAGAGAYRCNVLGELSGGGLTEPSFLATKNVAYSLTLGSGGVGGATPSAYNLPTSGTNGGDSQLGSIIAYGGGASGAAGGCSGGRTTGQVGMADSMQPAIEPLKTAEGLAFGFASGSVYDGWPVKSGGGGAGGPGAPVGSIYHPANGGPGVTSSITGQAITRGGGGAGGRRWTYWSGSTAGQGGSGGGGAVNTAAAAGTGGGAGGVDVFYETPSPGRNGGSGAVILRVPIEYGASFTSGVTFTSSTVGSYRVYIITAAGPTDTVTFS